MNLDYCSDFVAVGCFNILVEELLISLFSFFPQKIKIK